MVSRRTRLAAALALSVSWALSAGAPAKELHWRSFEVEARLETDGTLAISEVQRMVMTGEWNGGERKFRLGDGQRLTLDRIVRLDPGGVGGTELVAGDLDHLDRFDWTSSDTLRWRSRLPSDPPYDSSELDYRLDYRITGALRKIGERSFQLDHQFAFSDRDGVIERLVVHLTLAPEWRASSSLPSSWDLGPLAPGKAFVLTTDFTFEGEGLPANATPPQLPDWLRLAAVVAFVVGAQAFLWKTRRRDRALGRFAVQPHDPLDGAWLEEHVFSLPPEVVGAMWDRVVGSAEVAATLARLTQEGKLKTAVQVSGRIFRSENLHLELLADRSTLSDYETKLIDGLFGNESITDTESIRKRYRGTGFDPAAKIRAGVEERLKRVRGFAEGSPKPAWRPTGLLLLAGFALLLLTALGAASRLLATPASGAIAICFFIGMALVVGAIPGFIGALVGQGRVGALAGPYFGLLLSQVAMAGTLWGLSSLSTAHPLHLAGGLLFALGLVRSQANVLATRESAESLLRRRELARARDFFEAQLASSQPQLEDRWFPYLLAFGLAPRMERWFRRFGGLAKSSAASYSSMSGGSSASSASGSGGWSGGGGAFGGGGASATWAMAATAMSSGVSAPSSSGGSSGGGGGGSSGGGGGGGW
ncbi:MAG: hypothetical protein ABIV06_00835 [Thermoanaerobaculia bacterium]